MRKFVQNGLKLAEQQETLAILVARTGNFAFTAHQVDCCELCFHQRHASKKLEQHQQTSKDFFCVALQFLLQCFWVVAPGSPASLSAFSSSCSMSSSTLATVLLLLVPSSTMRPNSAGVSLLWMLLTSSLALPQAQVFTWGCLPLVWGPCHSPSTLFHQGGEKVKHKRVS